MNMAITITAIAGLATIASAQEFSLSMGASHQTIDASGGAMLTIDVYGDADIGTHIWAYQFGLTTHGSSMVENISFEQASWANFVNTNTGYDGNGGIGAVSGSQYTVCTSIPKFCPPPGVGSEIGGLLGTFTIDLRPGSSGELDIDFAPSIAFPDSDGLYVVEWINSGTDDSPAWLAQEYWDSTQNDATTHYFGTSVTVVPAPPSVGLLGLLFLFPRRR